MKKEQKEASVASGEEQPSTGGGAVDHSGPASAGAAEKHDALEDEAMRFFGGAKREEPQEDPMSAMAAEAVAGPSLEELEEQLRAAQAEAEAQRNAHVRALAEMQNVRKRFERESQQARQFALEGFARDLLTVADNLERALAAVPKECSAELQMFREGVAMTQNELSRVFGKQGVVRIEALNAPFDPNLHQAVLQVETATAAAGTVVQEMQAGYLLNGRLLRPAMVGVALEVTPPSPEPPEEVPENDP
ncbi:MAG: nucleotide exchange factor GrpE [Magnetococcales bacterium]|nr:nucleotide exchange factor GrpE [Magnetococcales bacterium]